MVWSCFCNNGHARTRARSQSHTRATKHAHICTHTHAREEETRMCLFALFFSSLAIVRERWCILELERECGVFVPRVWPRRVVRIKEVRSSLRGESRVIADDARGCRFQRGSGGGCQSGHLRLVPLRLLQKRVRPLRIVSFFLPPRTHGD